MIQLRHQQASLWEGWLAEEVAELWEPWMRVVDQWLEDDERLEAVYQAQGKRQRRSRTRGRRQRPAEVALRRLILKHVRNWSYEIGEREVRANVGYRSFCRIGMAKVLQEKALLRLGQAMGPETIRELHDRIVGLAQERRVVRQTKARVFDGVTQLPGKLVSPFEPHTEIIRKGKVGKPNEFGKLVQLQEAENQIITHYEQRICWGRLKQE